MNNLPPEMQARIDEIVNQAQMQAAPQRQQPAKPQIVKQPSLMDHTLSLRQEVADMRNEVAQLTQQMHAQGQVTEAVGQAVGQLYAMFCQQTETTDQSATYAAQFQQQAPEDF